MAVSTPFAPFRQSFIVVGRNPSNDEEGRLGLPGENSISDSNHCKLAAPTKHN